jgi:hypothetical protein
VIGVLQPDGFSRADKWSHAFTNDAPDFAELVTGENTILFALYDSATPAELQGTVSARQHPPILNERGFRSEVIERQLAHDERNEVRASYYHAQYLTERCEMMKGGRTSQRSRRHLYWPSEAAPC